NFHHILFSSSIIIQIISSCPKMEASQKVVKKCPEILPPDNTTFDKCSSTNYMKAPWVDGMIMRTVHLRVTDPGKIRSVISFLYLSLSLSFIFFLPLL